MSDAYSGTPSADSYYERLGVDRSASDDDIDTASKRAKRAVHPDNNSSEQATAEREFDRVTDAGDALTDSESRAAYDTFVEEQGPDTGTELYEQWDAEGRPQSPSGWLAQPRSTDTTTATADSTATTTADSTATTA
ncbi:MAG: DnaJ-class molecular chaperone with C-terminal Zn finger domain protein, partial [Halonotius sp. J07HN6]